MLDENQVLIRWKARKKIVSKFPAQKRLKVQSKCQPQKKC